LAGGEATLLRAAWKQILARPPETFREIVTNRLTRLLGDLEADRAASLLLAKAHEIAAPQLAVDREVRIPAPAAKCPTGFIGTPPNCKPIVQKCPKGTIGDYPNCKPVNSQDIKKL
jgi:hypothetical protein